MSTRTEVLGGSGSRSVGERKLGRDLGERDGQKSPEGVLEENCRTSDDGKAGEAGAGHGRRAQGGAGSPVAMGPAPARAGPLAAAGTPPAEAAEPAPGR